MDEQGERTRTICFTGHRPEKIHCPEEMIKKALEQKIRQAVSDGWDVFISGMARGVDIWAAQIVLKLRDEGANIKLICACPYHGVETGWGREWKNRYREVLDAADETVYICEGYMWNCFRLRNTWMVDHAAMVIAVYHGEKGGTKNTVDYAERTGVPVVYIDG